MTIHKGDIVNFLNDVGGGKVIQIDEDKKQVYVETEDGFDVGPIPISEVLLRSKPTDYPVEVPAPEKLNRHTFKPEKGYLDPIDLHKEALPTRCAGMNDVEVHRFQLDYFRLRMREAVRYRGKRVVVIHGKGDGTLKNEVRQILKREYAGKVEFHDADFSKYEEGATLVIIK